MTDPIIVPDRQKRESRRQFIAATGTSFDIHEWSGSGPGYLHGPPADDEPWHILERTLTFGSRHKQGNARPGNTGVSAPPGWPHDLF